MFLAILASVLTLSSAVPIGPPTAASTDVIYLVNCQAAPGQSAMAYYASNYRALAGYEPDEIALVGTSPFVHWEGNTFEAEFDNGESRLGVFMTHINSGADEKVLLGGIAGTAEAEFVFFCLYILFLSWAE
ncbi:hypothetical protein B0J14DRAFT_594924 [Halenospora varia]|nr:hypothetical protein B0J14DRAFT_594924 [Halenospora varia]